MAASSFNKAITEVLKHEGGYSNDRADPGGPTNHGVTLGEAKQLGLDIDHDGDVDVIDVKLLTEVDAAKVFHEFYWRTCRCDELPAGVDYAVFDFAVNSGNNRSIRFLQGIVGVAVDGTLGPMTLAAIRKRDALDIVTQLCDNRLAWLKQLSTWSVFGGGWGTRVADLKAIASKMALNQVPIPPAPFPTPPDAPTPAWPAPQHPWAFGSLFRSLFGK